MTPISVVIIARNEAHIIAETISIAHTFSHDIIVVDSGSTDGTRQLVTSLGAQLIETGWDGFGANKNKGIEAARYDWILSLDADEQPDNDLIFWLQSAAMADPLAVYNVNFQTFLGSKRIRFGEWGKDAHIRLFNRQHVRWNNAAVHEQLVIPQQAIVHQAKGFVLHRTMRHMADYATKITSYALLSATNYHTQKKKATWIKRNMAPLFSFIKHYVFKLGFLDGRAGYRIAKMTAFYTFLKYARLDELYHAEQQNKR